MDIDYSYATKCYNWKGEITGYSVKNGWIPADTDNYAAKELYKKIQKGDCELIEPEIDRVMPVLDDKKVLRGYRWQDKFVPADPSNALYNLINTTITKCDCIVEKCTDEGREKGKPVKEIVLGIYFDSQWQSFADSVKLSVEYPYKSTNANPYKVCLRNIYSKSDSTLDQLIAAEYSIEPPLPTLQQKVQRGAVLEIIVPVHRLKNIFRSYCLNMSVVGQDINYVQDQLEMHLTETGRTKKNGPTTQWLLDHLYEYSEDFVRDVGNRALEAYSLDAYAFEDRYLKYISSKDLYFRHYVIRRFEDDSVAWGFPVPFTEPRFVDFGGGHFGNDSSRDILNHPSEKGVDEAQNSRLPLKKVRIMLENGLTLEALCILNGYLEVSFRRAIARALLSADKQLFGFCLNLSHKRRLELIKRMGKQGYVQDPKGYVEKAFLIDSFRNGYLHALARPEKSLFLTNVMRMKIEDLMKPFLGAYENHQFEIFLDMFRVTPEVEMCCQEEFKSVKQCNAVSVELN